VLANLFLHYAFDAWMEREFLTIAFERYVDDAVVHCISEKQALLLRDKIGARLASVGLTLHPEKTKIVYCKDGRRSGSREQTSFTFLGYTFRARAARDKHGEKFISFLPAISKDAMKAINAEVRGWRLHQHNTWTLGQLARWINPIVRGWLQYYGRVYRSALYRLQTHQHLSGAVGPQEISAATWVQESQRLVERSGATLPTAVRSVGLDPGFSGAWTVGAV